MNEVADIAIAIARTKAPAMEKLGQLLIVLHRHNTMTLAKETHMHDLIVAAMRSEMPAEAARAVRSAFIPIFHPVLMGIAFNTANVLKQTYATRFASS